MVFKRSFVKRHRNFIFSFCHFLFLLTLLKLVLILRRRELSVLQRCKVFSWKWSNCFLKSGLCLFEQSWEFGKLACPVRRVTNWIGAVYKRLLELFYLLRIWGFDFVLGANGLLFSKLYCLLFSCHRYQMVDVFVSPTKRRSRLFHFKSPSNMSCTVN